MLGHPCECKQALRFLSLPGVKKMVGLVRVGTLLAIEMTRSPLVLGLSFDSFERRRTRDESSETFLRKCNGNGSECFEQGLVLLQVPRNGLCKAKIKVGIKVLARRAYVHPAS